MGVPRRTEKSRKEREWQIWRRTDGGDGQIHGSDAGSSEENGTKGGFSLGSWDDGRSSTPMIAENNDLNVNKNHLINISVNPNVLDSCKLIAEVKVDNVRMEVLDIIDKVREISDDFNPEVRCSLRPTSHKDLELREWEKNILVHLNSVNLVERDDRKTSYVKFKLFKQDIYSLALVDMGNLVKGTLVSSEFWKIIRGKMLKDSNARVNTAEKGGIGLRVREKRGKDLVLLGWPGP